MSHPKYLFKKGENFYFRRRIPGLSTILSPVFLSLGTKSEFFAHTCLSKLTMEFDDMLEAFIFAVDELPEDLIARYMTVRLQHAVTDIRRQHRMERRTGRGNATNPTSIEAKKIVLEILLKDGIRKSFPLHLVQQDWGLHQLGAVMDAYRVETDLAASPALKSQLAAEFTSATGVVPASLEHHAQILEIYFHAKIASLETSDDQRLQRLNAFRDMSAKLIEQTAPAISDGKSGKTVDGPGGGAHRKIKTEQSNTQKTTTTKPDQALVLTPGVEIITEPLTMALLNAQFATAAQCDEALHRSHSDEPFGVDIAGACERSIKVALEAGHIDQKTGAGCRAKMKLFCLLTGVQTVTEIEQYHLHVFEERLANTPLNFNRSHKDAELTLAAINILADGLSDEELGRSASTFNSHIDTIGAVLRHARAFDHSAVHPDIDTRLVRRREKTRGRKKRNAFKPAEIKKLFQHHVWHGCKSPARRQEPGQLIKKDGLYFVPLIVAYTGSRMEEIAGLTTDAILPADGGFGFDICPHDQRRLKNPQSERLVRDYCSAMVTRLKSVMDTPDYQFLKEDAAGNDPLLNSAENYVDRLLGLQRVAGRYQKQRQLCVIDLNDASDEIVELASSVVSRLIFDRMRRADPRNKMPVHLILEEAHRYISEKPSRFAIDAAQTFQRIAKEGRKYGVFLIVASQRPSELSKTVLSQCNNYIIHRIQNPDDLSQIRQMTPFISDTVLRRLPSLPKQHALIFGNAVNIPTTFKVREAKPTPNSNDTQIRDLWYVPIDPKLAW